MATYEGTSQVRDTKINMFVGQNATRQNHQGVVHKGHRHNQQPQIAWQDLHE